MTRCSDPSRCERRSGLTLVETVMSTTLVAVVLLGATNMLGSVVKSRTANGDKVRATHMAQQLMTEIVSADYEEQGAGGLLDGILSSHGVETGESGRATYDDVDDYHGWTESPLQARNGTALANTTAWRRTVAVEFVNSANPAVTVGSDDGVKRITVSVFRSGVLAARLVALRSDKCTP